jgi:hypothetical protein
MSVMGMLIALVAMLMFVPVSTARERRCVTWSCYRNLALLKLSLKFLTPTIFILAHKMRPHLIVEGLGDSIVHLINTMQ